MGVQEPNLNAHPTRIQKGREHVARLDRHKGEEIGTFIPGRDHGRIGPHDNLIEAAFGDPSDRAQDSNRLSRKRAAGGGENRDALPLETARPPSRLDHRVLRPSAIVDGETDGDDREDRLSEELQVGATGVDGYEKSKDSRHRMDDAEHDLESIRARMLDAASELESTPATPAVLNRDDAGAPRAESPRSDIHTSKSPRRPLTYCSRRAADAPDTCASIRVEDDGALTGVSGLVIACSPGNSGGSPLLVSARPSPARGFGGCVVPPATLFPRLL